MDYKQLLEKVKQMKEEVKNKEHKEILSYVINFINTMEKKYRKLIVIDEKYKDKFNYCNIIPNTIIFSTNLPKDVIGIIMDRKWVNIDV